MVFNLKNYLNHEEINVSISVRRNMFSTKNSEGARACVSVFSVYKTVVPRTFIYSFNTSLTRTYFVYIKNASHIEQLCPKSVNICLGCFKVYR